MNEGRKKDRISERKARRIWKGGSSVADLDPDPLHLDGFGSRST